MLVLPDAVEEVRNICMKIPNCELDPNKRFDIKPLLLVKEDGTYVLDPAHDVSAPQLSSDAMLKKTRVKLHHITDHEMKRILENSMPHGIFMINGRYDKGNTKDMCSLLDPNKPQIYIINLDGNTRYGKAMCYPLPSSGFTSVTEEEWAKIDWLAQREDKYTGYFAECERLYPPELQDSQKDYRDAPESRRHAESVE